MTVILKSRSCGTCGNCFSLEDGSPDMKNVGECRGAPPQIVVLPDPKGISIQTLFPRVEYGWDCGSWKPRLSS